MPALTGAQIPKRAQWPSLGMTGNGRADAGPTGAPWVNANGWLVRIARFLDPTKPVVLDTVPSPSARPASHVLAVADAMAYGGAWAVQFAAETWPAVQKALAFFERNAAWRAWEPVAELTLISTFTGADESIAGECLNLLTRRQVGVRLASPGSPVETRAAAWVSNTPVPYEKYMSWIRGGGTLIVHGEDNSRTEGNGRIIGRPESWSNAYAAASGIHLALTRRTDVLRLWNAGSFNSYYQQAANRGVVHLINYSTNRGADNVSIWLARPWKQATLTTFENRTPLMPRASNGGIEIPLPQLGVYAAIELEGE